MRSNQGGNFDNRERPAYPPQQPPPGPPSNNMQQRGPPPPHAQAPAPHSRLPPPSQPPPSYGYGNPPPPPGSYGGPPPQYAPYPPQHQQQQQDRNYAGDRGGYHPPPPPPNYGYEAQPPPPPTSAIPPPSPSGRGGPYGQHRYPHDTGDRNSQQPGPAMGAAPQHSSPPRRHDGPPGPPPPPPPPNHAYQYPPQHGHDPRGPPLPPPPPPPPQSYYENGNYWGSSGDVHRQPPPPPPPPANDGKSQYEHDHRRPLPPPPQSSQQQQPRPPSDYYGSYRYDEQPIHPSTTDSRGHPPPPYMDDRYRHTEHPSHRSSGDPAHVTPETRSPSEITSNHVEDVTNAGCTCKKSKCLKLYCQCFAASIMCGPDCRCLVCHNTPRHEQDRKEAVRAILSRNPTAFETKFKSTNGAGSVPVKTTAAVPGGEEKVLAHKSGCKCRKSACLKKYCECYHAGVKCNVNCRCVGCQNMPPGGFGPPGAHGMRPEQHHWAAQHYSYPPADYHRGRNPPLPPPPPPPPPPPRSEPWMMDAAQNLTFLKHASPEKKHPTGLQEAKDSSSVPSLDTADTTSRSQEDPDGCVSSSVHHPDGSVSIHPSAHRSPPQKQQTDNKGTDKSSGKVVDALLMAAYAMTELNSNKTPPSTPPKPAEDKKNDTEPTSSNHTTPRASPKRKPDDETCIYDKQPDGENLPPDKRSRVGSSGKKRSDADNNNQKEFEIKHRLLANRQADDDNSDNEGDSSEGRTDTSPEKERMDIAPLPPPVNETPKDKSTKVNSVLTPVSARCIDFQNMGMNSESQPSTTKNKRVQI